MKYMKDWLKENKKPDGSQYIIHVDGLKIYTTIDSRMQQYAEQAVATYMPILQNSFINISRRFDSIPAPFDQDLRPDK